MQTTAVLVVFYGGLGLLLIALLAWLLVPTLRLPIYRQLADMSAINSFPPPRSFSPSPVYPAI